MATTGQISAIKERMLLVGLGATLALALFCWPQPVAAQGSAPDLVAYQGWLREAYAAAQRGDRLGLEQAAKPLLAANSVTLPDGSSMATQNGWLRGELSATEPDLPRITARLGALIDALARPGQDAPADADEQLRGILSQPPFVDEQVNRRTLLGDFADWLFALLDRLLDYFLGPLFRAGGGVSGPVARLLGAVGLVLIVAILGYVLISVRRSVVREVRTADDDPEAGLTAASATQQAGQLARSGDYRTAVRYMYLAALLRLEERGLLRYNRALTNREYLLQLNDNGPLRSKLAPIVETFDQVWYGYVPLDDQGFEAYRRQVEGLG